MSAEYLFQPDKHYDVRYDTGDKTIQCGRRPDAFKLWLGWKAKGTTGFESHVDKCFRLATYFETEIRKRPDLFKPVLEEVLFLIKSMLNVNEGLVHEHMLLVHSKTAAIKTY